MILASLRTTMGSMVETGDCVLRAITDDDTFRVMVARTTDTVLGAFGVQEPTGVTAEHFAKLLTGVILIRETMAPHYRVQAILRDPGSKGSLVVDAQPDGMTRGLVRGEDELRIEEGSSLEMTRGLAQGQTYRSVVRPPAGGTIADALMTYLQESEQIVSVIATGLLQGDEGVVHAGGYVIQLLPGAAREPLMVMTQRLESMPRIEQLLGQLGGDPQALLDELLYRIPYAQLDRRPVRHGCSCSQEAMLASLGTLPRAEIDEMVRAGEMLQISCDYCRTDYKVPPARLSGLLRSS